MRNGRNEILVNFSLSTLCAPFGQMKSADTRYSLNTCHCRTFGHSAQTHLKMSHSAFGISKIRPENMWELLIQIVYMHFEPLLLCIADSGTCIIICWHIAHAPKRKIAWARAYTVHLSVCQPEWNWASQICDHVYLSMLKRSHTA